MLRFRASIFVDIANLLREMEAIAFLSSGKGIEVTPADSDRVTKCSGFLKSICDRHGWKNSSKKCDRIIDHFARNQKANQPVTHDYLHPALKELRERVEDEIEEDHFLHLDPREDKLYENPTKDWETVVSRFPVTRYNIEESGKCYALERYGAAVFHVLQVAEYGVIEIAKLLKVEGDKPGWGSLQRLGNLIKEPYPKRIPLAQKHSKLLDNVVPLTTVIKDSWRHKLDHVDNQIIWVDTDFSPQVASEIISATRAFMRKLSVELPEANHDGKRGGKRLTRKQGESREGNENGR